MPSSENARIVDLFTRRIGTGADPTRVAAASARVWARIAADLQPIIGSGGMSALFARSVFITARRFPRLEAVPEAPSLTLQLDALQALLLTLGGREAIDVAAALLQAFIELLTSMVGPKLTGEMLRSVWDIPETDTPVKDVQQ
jgi:hypothetical protein